MQRKLATALSATTPSHHHLSPAAAPFGILALLTLTIVAVLLVASPANAQTDLELCFLDKINAERAAVGTQALTWAGDVADYTRDHAREMATAGNLYHSTPAALDAALPDGWYAWGENVGYISVADCEGMHQGFMDSSGHRENLLNGTYQYAATGVHIDADGWLWTTHVFFAADGYNPGNNAGFDGSFGDDDGSTFEPYIEALVAEGITNGCGDGLFCPKDSVNREQMAAFLNRGLSLPNRGSFGFKDVPAGSTFAADINAIAWQGITRGCGGGSYCPDDLVTREQMAAFLVRALKLPPGPDAGFKDVDPASTFADAINRLAAAGITSGCGNGNYCPGDHVNREQMAAFLVRALDL